MICAFVHPQASRFLARVDDLAAPKRFAARAALAAAALAALAAYYTHIFTLPKAAYNTVHPYTSWMPLTIWIVLRNLTPSQRTYSLRLFGWLGCITLETYLCQFHIWLRSEVPNGQPKFLLELVPGYPLLNFAAATAMYVYVSHRLFVLTNALKDVAVPHDDNRTLGRNLAMLLVTGAAVYALGVAAHVVLQVV